MLNTAPGGTRAELTLTASHQIASIGPPHTRGAVVPARSVRVNPT